MSNILDPIKPLIDQLSKHQKLIFFLLTVAAGIYMLWPLHNFQHYLSQGDHGRDLYCFKMVMQGAIPYHDFSWLFGPLMPYYYAAFYTLGGISIQSVLLGQNILILLVGIFIYLSCVTFLPPMISSVCAIWYWSFRGVEFFYTYNHIGGVLALFISLFCIFQYIQQRKLNYLYGGFISIFLFNLIRLNMGIAVLAAYVLSLLIIELVHNSPNKLKRLRLCFIFSFIVICITGLAYWAITHSLPEYVLRQSFPFSKSQRTDYTSTPLSSVYLLFKLIFTYLSATLPQKIFGALIILSSIHSLTLILTKKFERKIANNLLLVFTTLGLFIIFTMHEFIASGVHYRLQWAFPLFFVLIFTSLSTAIKNIQSKYILPLISLTLFLPCLFNTVSSHKMINQFKLPYHSINIGENTIYTSQHPLWFKTITDATNFLKTNVPESDTILALPLDPLYLFLSERKSAAHQLVFFEHFNISEEQELATIAQMEANNGNWVIVSNRSNTKEVGMGIFGETYCPLIAKYIDDHFKQVAQFGDWINHPGWAWNHGVKIYKRN